MGSARWDPAAWAHYAGKTKGKSRKAIFTATTLDPYLDPKTIAVRESRDSVPNPNATPIIVAVDVTGSMGMLAEALVKRGLKPLFEEIIARKPVTDPHVMAMAVGDAHCDSAPLQVSQFEADLTIAAQIEKIYLEGGGGGNRHESYHLPWYFAATRTAIDSMEKRNTKGYLFTVGDEECPPELKASHVRAVLGGGLEADLDSRDVLAMASRCYEVFHVVVEEGWYARNNIRRVMKSWTEMLGQRVLRLSDHGMLSEVIVSAIEVNEGRDPDSVARSWSGPTASVVGRAVSSLVPAKRSDNSGPVAL